jgi:uncharacterized protein YqjF (DUF2071 family)
MKVSPDVVRRAVMVQRWCDVVFLHWRYDPDEVQRLLPDGLEVDVYQDQAWVGLVPFRMEGLGFPWLHPLPHVGGFPEVNVRTYVRAQGRPGVWFFSLDVDRLAPAVTARVAYGLPYCSGAVQHVRAGNVVASTVERHWPVSSCPAMTSVAVRTATFLTARWGLYSTTRRGRLRNAAVDHAPWPLRRAEVEVLDDHLVTAAGLPAPDGAPHALYSPGVDVRVGRPRSVSASPTS